MCALIIPGFPGRVGTLVSAENQKDTDVFKDLLHLPRISNKIARFHDFFRTVFSRTVGTLPACLWQ